MRYDCADNSIQDGFRETPTPKHGKNYNICRGGDSGAEDTERAQGGKPCVESGNVPKDAQPGRKHTGITVGNGRWGMQANDGM
jgi:hypothetical protein